MSISILFSFSFISLVKLETSQSLAKSDVALVKEFSMLPKIVDNSTCFILYLVNAHALLLKWKKVGYGKKRLCHVNFDNMVKIRKFRKVRGIPNLKKPDVGLCKNHQIGKMRKTSFKSKNYQSEDILEIVHTDLWGPIGVESYTGENLFIPFVDDFYVLKREVKGI